LRTYVLSVIGSDSRFDLDIEAARFERLENYMQVRTNIISTRARFRRVLALRFG
jgi:hypothetical protein